MQVEFIDQIARLRINTGHANAISPEFLQNLSNAWDKIESSKARAVIITGYDKYFSAGLNLPTLLDFDRSQMDRFIHAFGDISARIYGCGLPVVGAINGHAIAGGCLLALVTDYRIMAAGNAKIGFNEIQLGVGLPPQVTEVVRQQIPATSWLAVAFEGKLFDPEEARTAGLVHEIVASANLEQAALDKATQLAALPQLGFAQIKSSFRNPVMAAISEVQEREVGQWLDTWFSEAARARIAAAITHIAAKK